jgi:predicted nucleotide-binding protein (sugar kinase/HSP70/actin superfamily)
MINKAIKHYKKPVELPFSKEQRDRTTILFGGLTLNHEHLIKGALKSLGYNADYLPVPDNLSLQKGKEYGNRGQCNPTYYTVGNLIRHLNALKTTGIKDVEDKFVFLTAGACGPCRFGMYESEYRKSLKEAGFGKFRILTFEQSDRFEKGSDNGLQANRAFYKALIKALVLGDMLNEIGYRVRPYEKNTGETDDLIAVYRNSFFNAFLDSTSITATLRGLCKRLNGIEVDYTRVKPVVQIIGEFWAQTTEGDGSYRLARWLESEGAEVKTEPVSTWIDYLLWSSALEEKDRFTIKPLRSTGRLIGIFMLKRLFKFYFNTYRRALGGWIYRLPSQNRLADYASPYFNVRITGGEGHLEVGKHIMAFEEKKAHMVVSVKPFGCMPSTLSDGVQSKVTGDLSESIFVSIETSGDAEVNVKSRVQMKLYEAKQRAKEEFNKAIHEHGIDYRRLKGPGKISSLSNPMIDLPHLYTGTAANFAAYLSKQAK